MKHRVDHRKLSRNSAHRKALLRTLTTQLILHEKLTINEAEINDLKNKALIELRNQLDKAFREYYCGHYSASTHNIYFPVVPNLQVGETVEKKLQQYFANLGQKDFSVQQPMVFQLLLDIQPLAHPAYLWLRQLYKLANQQKHDHTLPLSPIVDGVSVDMKFYLPCVLNGAFELLLRLFQPTLNVTGLNLLDFFPPLKQSKDYVAAPSRFFAPGITVLQQSNTASLATPNAVCYQYAIIHS